MQHAEICVQKLLFQYMWQRDVLIFIISYNKSNLYLWIRCNDNMTMCNIVYQQNQSKLWTCCLQDDFMRRFCHLQRLKFMIGLFRQSFWCALRILNLLLFISSLRTSIMQSNTICNFCLLSFLFKYSNA